MKGIFIEVSFFILFSLACLLTPSAQSNYLLIKQFKLDSITAIGKPIGEKITQEIDKDGGTIFSNDGRAELIIPQGALSKKRKITIQDITNHTANGRGNAYQMEPSGLQFQKPVTLVVHYSTEELMGTSAEFKGIAWQDDKGKWQEMPETTLDTVAKTITTKIDHFSSYSSFDKIVLKPEQARVKVEKSIQMEIHFTISDLDNDIALPPTIPAPEWTVNDIDYGNTDVGRITPTNYNANYARYTAPVSVPAQNPVAVSAVLKGLQFKFKRTTFKDPALVSNLLIYDKAYRITMDTWLDNSQDGICTVRSEDHGAFTLVMEGTRTQVKEIVNQNLQVRLNPCPCALIWVNRPNAGPINTVGASRIEVTPASLPATPFSKVRIMLNHLVAPLPVFTTSCPGRTAPPPGGGVALPPLIEFEANNEPEQKITLSEITRGSLQNNRLHGINIVIKLIDENNR